MNTSIVYQCYFDRAFSGISIAASLRRLEIPRPTFYGWMEAHPEEALVAREQAEQDAAIESVDRAGRVEAAKAALGANLAELATNAVEELLKELVEDAKSGTPWFRLGLFRELTKMLETSAAEVPLLPAPVPTLVSPEGQRRIAFDNVSTIEVEGKDGSKLSFKASDPLEGTVTDSSEPE